jgi:hypothetical protein
MKRIYLDIYIWKIKKFQLGISHSLVDAIDIYLGFWTVVIFYKPEREENV